MPSYICGHCGLDCPTYNVLIEHGIKVHGEKVVDPGNEFSGPNAKKLKGIISWLRREPDANLKTGEGKLLLDEIDRLTKEVDKAYSEGYRDGCTWADENPRENQRDEGGMLENP